MSGHIHDCTFEKVDAKYLKSAADCENAAVYYKSCACGEKGSVTFEYGTALGHTEGAVVVENNIDPTCTATGSYDNVVYCTVCEKEISRETNNAVENVTDFVGSVTDKIVSGIQDGWNKLFAFFG